jgi:hypothetical protein
MVVVDSSTFGFDALLRGKPVAVLDPYAAPAFQEVMSDVVAAKGALYSRSPHGLSEQIRTVLRDSGERAALQHEAEAFISRYVSALGDEATERIVSHLLSAEPCPIQQHGNASIQACHVS